MMNDEHAKQSTDVDSGQNMAREGDLHGGTLSSSNPAFRNLALKGLKGNIIPEQEVRQDTEESVSTNATVKEASEDNTSKVKPLTEKATKARSSKVKSSKDTPSTVSSSKDRSSKGSSDKVSTSREKVSKGKSLKALMRKEKALKERTAKKKKSKNKSRTEKNSDRRKTNKAKISKGKDGKRKASNIDLTIDQKAKPKGTDIAGENLSSFSRWLHDLAPVGPSEKRRTYETVSGRVGADEMTKDVSNQAESRKDGSAKDPLKKAKSRKGKLTKAKANKIKSLKAKPSKKIKSSKGKSTKKKNKKKQRDKGVVLSNDVFSETLADLLASQGHKTQAIHMYDKMRLIYPEKSRFFAAKIEELNKKE